MQLRDTRARAVWNVLGNVYTARARVSRARNHKTHNLRERVQTIKTDSLTPQVTHIDAHSLKSDRLVQLQLAWWGRASKYIIMGVPSLVLPAPA